MHKPCYRLNRVNVNDLAVCTAHLRRGDPSGLNDRQTALYYALDYRTTERQRELMYLYYNCGLNQQQIAQRKHIAVSTVCRTLQRAAANVGFRPKC